VPERRVRLVVHYSQGSFPVWKLGPLVDDNLDPASLPIPADLAAELTAWGQAHPAAAGSDVEAFLERGAALTGRLANDLGPGYHVTFAGDQAPVQYFRILDDRSERPTGLLRRTLPAAFKIDTGRYPNPATARAAIEEATSLLTRRQLAFEVATYAADPFPAVPSWEAVREQLGWHQPAEDQESRGR
jgi:hypothetical protein